MAITTPIQIDTGAKLYDKLANCHPSLSRGQVWCSKCGRTTHVNGSDALAGRNGGWPRCCGYTMTIDSPEERVALKAHRAEAA